jgi:hypothetical protein
MRLLIGRVLPRVVPNLALFGALIAAAPTFAVAQGASDTAGTSQHGIKNVLYLAIRSDRNSQFLQQSFAEPEKATLTVKIRISAHSKEANFYGDVPATISNFDLIKGSREHEVWQDARCHHERGYPKLTVINVDGAVTNKETILPIAARYRWIGLMLPQDEVMPSRLIATGTDDVGRFIATRTITKKSHLFIDMKLYILPCILESVQTKREMKNLSVE